MEAAASAIGAIAGLGVLAVVIGGTIWLARWMLEPINRAAGALGAPTRFMLVDSLALMILLQIGLAICGQALADEGTREADANMYWLMLFLVVVLVLVLWAASVSVVSRAGIRRPLRRVAVIVLLVPGTLATIMGTPALLAFLVMAISRTLRGERGAEWMSRQIPLAMLGLV